MKHALLVAACTFSLSAFAGEPMKADPAKAEPAKAEAAKPEMSCMQVMAAKMPMVEKFGALMAAHAESMEMHAKWVGTKDKAAKAESAMLKKMAKYHRDMAALAQKIHADMAKGKDMAMAPHDPKTMDPKAGEVMAKSLAVQKEFISLMQKDVEMMEKMMAAPKAGGSAGAK